MRLIGTVLLLMLASPAWGHDHSRPDLDAWYLSLQVPNDHSGFAKGQSCCNKRDCAPRRVRHLPDGSMEAQGDDGAWAAIPALSIIRDNPNPRFQWEICIIGGKVACAVPGQSGG